MRETESCLGHRKLQSTAQPSHLTKERNTGRNRTFQDKWNESQSWWNLNVTAWSTESAAWSECLNFFPVEVCDAYPALHRHHWLTRRCSVMTGSLLRETALVNEKHHLWMPSSSILRRVARRYWYKDTLLGTRQRESLFWLFPSKRGTQARNGNELCVFNSHRQMLRAEAVPKSNTWSHGGWLQEWNAT